MRGTRDLGRCSTGAKSWRASRKTSGGEAAARASAKFGEDALLAVTWEAADPDDLGEKGACLAGVQRGAAACARLLPSAAHADAKEGRSGAALTAAVQKELRLGFRRRSWRTNSSPCTTRRGRAQHAHVARRGRRCAGARETTRGVCTRTRRCARRRRGASTSRAPRRAGGHVDDVARRRGPNASRASTICATRESFSSCA